MSKKKQKIKVVHRTTTIPKEDEVKKVKEEIQELETKKAQAGKGVGGFLRRMAINRQQYDKRAFIAAKDKLRATKQQNELGIELVEKEKIKTALAEQRKKNQVNFGDLYKGL